MKQRIFRFCTRVKQYFTTGLQFVVRSAIGKLQVRHSDSSEQTNDSVLSPVMMILEKLILTCSANTVLFEQDADLNFKKKLCDRNKMSMWRLSDSHFLKKRKKCKLKQKCQVK